MAKLSTAPTLDPTALAHLLEARHGDPFSALGLHSLGEGSGFVIRAFLPYAQEAIVEAEGERTPMVRVHPDGLFEAVFAQATERFDYKLVIDRNSPTVDPYSIGTMLEEQDAYYFSEGTHRQLWQVFGAHNLQVGGVDGTRFRVWAPNAHRVSVVGDFNSWDGRIHPMRNCGGIWEIFIPDVGQGAHYKFEVVGHEGHPELKCDPFAFFSQNGEQTASIVHQLDNYAWQDSAWMTQRATRDQYHSPMSVYEVHLGSWKRKTEDGGRYLSYLEYADELVDYVVEMGFTHIELMPVSEYPFDGSWGYQVTGYFAPTSRYGSPDEFRAFVDKCHQRGIGVIVDWVPAHFPKDAHGLAKFDGTALYEHSDPRQGEHMDWGTLIFNYGRNEVRNFLVANALFWFKEYHIDGIRVDAVASMLYLDYSREEGQWVPNEFGGRENLQAIEFIKQLNHTCYEECPGIMTIAEESTAFPGVSRPIDMGGLGFGFKWNMGWMNDFLAYMERDPIHRKFHHGEATFAMVYAYDENYSLVLSHDEVVHGKGSMIEKMPGDRWQQLANLRLFYAWMFAHPGKKLLFQGCEFAQSIEWNHDQSLDWHLLEFDEHQGIQKAVRDLNQLYLSEPALYHYDHSGEGFEWIDHDDSENCIFSFVRKGDAGEAIAVVVNATPTLHENFRLGVPDAGFYEEIFNSDAETYGGANNGNYGGLPSESVGAHGRADSINITLPPLSTVFFKRRVV
ncbi:MAG: 1,4-alpha-glucan branching protein GlgB [Verrucomicrobiota bacterium]